MTVTPDSFRVVYPEFADKAAYPDTWVAAQIAAAGLQVNPQAWGEMLDYGTQLVVAHQLAKGRRRQRVAGLGGVPGEVTGPVASKGVDKISKAYDTGAVSFEGAGDWNATEYGVEFYRLAQMFGAGGMQVC